MTDFKIGDEVFVDTSKYSVFNYYTTTIVGETKLYWRLENGQLADKCRGRIRGSGEWDTCHIEPMTDEILAQIKKHEAYQLAKKNCDFLRSAVRVLSIESLYKINKLAEELRGEVK